MKKNYILVTLLMLLSITSNAQTAKSLNFDGIDDFIAIDNNLTATFTLEALIRPLQNSPTGGTAYEGAGIIDSDLGGSANDFIFSILNNKLSFWDGSVEVSTNGNTDIFDGNWHHVAIVKDAITGVSLYVDGVLDGQESYSSAVVLNENPKIYIGVAHVDGRYINADIDEVRIWNTARTVIELNTNKSSELTLPQSGLVSYYKFNQGIAGGNNTTETTLNDELGINNGVLNDFTLTGAYSNWLSNTTLSINNFSTINNSVQLYPNPASNFIQISSLNKIENYKIFDVLGSEMKTGIIGDKMKINIQSLTNGLYFLKLENGKSIKFIKK